MTPSFNIHRSTPNAYLRGVTHSPMRYFLLGCNKRLVQILSLILLIYYISEHKGVYWKRKSYNTILFFQKAPCNMCLNVVKGYIFKPTIMFWPRACMHLTQRVSVQIITGIMTWGGKKTLPRFNNMVGVLATFHVCGFWRRKWDLSFNGFLTTCVWPWTRKTEHHRITCKHWCYCFVRGKEPPTPKEYNSLHFEKVM